MSDSGIEGIEDPQGGLDGCGCRGLIILALLAFALIIAIVLGPGWFAGQPPGPPASVGPSAGPSAEPEVSFTPPPDIPPLACDGSGAITLEDHELLDEDWRLDVLATASVAITTAEHRDGARLVSLRFGGTEGVLDSFNTWLGGTYDPVACGPITGLDLAFRGRIVDRGTDAARLPIWLLLGQADTWYWTGSASVVGSSGSTDWESYRLEDIGGTWAYTGGGPPAPDVAAGPPITFGFLTAASCSGTCGGDVSVSAAIDDWEVTIRR